MPRPLRFAAFGLGVVLLAALAAGWWWMAYGKWPLAGSLRHDFGTVEIAGEGVSLTHVFQLRNRRDRELAVRAVLPSCGCAAAEMDSNRIGPGEEVEIEAVLRLSHAGVRESSITLILDDAGREVKQVLWIEGTGIKGSGLIPSVEAIALAPGEERRLLFTAELLDAADAPSAPAIELPDGLETEFEGWTLMAAGDPARRTASRWRGYLVLRWPEGAEVAIPDEAAIVTTIPGAPPARIALAERPRSVTPGP